MRTQLVDGLLAELLEYVRILCAAANVAVFLKQTCFPFQCQVGTVSGVIGRTVRQNVVEGNKFVVGHVQIPYRSLAGMIAL